MEAYIFGRSGGRPVPDALAKRLGAGVEDRLLLDGVRFAGTSRTRT